MTRAHAEPKCLGCMESRCPGACGIQVPLARLDSLTWGVKSGFPEFSRASLTWIRWLRPLSGELWRVGGLRSQGVLRRVHLVANFVVLVKYLSLSFANVWVICTLLKVGTDY